MRQTPNLSALARLAATLKDDRPPHPTASGSGEARGDGLGAAPGVEPPGHSVEPAALPGGGDDLWQPALETLTLVAAEVDGALRTGLALAAGAWDRLDEVPVLSPAGRQRLEATRGHYRTRLSEGLDGDAPPGDLAQLAGALALLHRVEGTIEALDAAMGTLVRARLQPLDDLEGTQLLAARRDALLPQGVPWLDLGGALAELTAALEAPR